MQGRFFNNEQHAGSRFANILMSVGPDVRLAKIEELVTGANGANGVNDLSAVIDYLEAECNRRKRLAQHQHYLLALKLSDVDAKSTITLDLSANEVEDAKTNKKLRQDNDQSFAHSLTVTAYSDDCYMALRMVAKYCDDMPYVWTTYRDDCVDLTKNLINACQSHKNCELLKDSLLAKIEGLTVRYNLIQ